MCETLSDLLILFCKPEEAVTTMQRAVDANPADLTAERALARAATETGQMLDQQDRFVRRLQWNPADVGAHWGLAAVYRIRSDLARELQHRQQVARLSPYDPDAHEALAEFLRARVFRCRESAAAFRRAIELRPESAPYHAGLGLALALQGDREGARDACRRAKDLDSRDVIVQSLWVQLALEHIAPGPLAGVLGGIGRDVDTIGQPAGFLGSLHEEAQSTADVEQAARPWGVAGNDRQAATGGGDDVVLVGFVVLIANYMRTALRYSSPVRTVR